MSKKREPDTHFVEGIGYPVQGRPRCLHYLELVGLPPRKAESEKAQLSQRIWLCGKGYCLFGKSLMAIQLFAFFFFFFFFGGLPFLLP
jgi:hypothetical protein